MNRRIKCFAGLLQGIFILLGIFLFSVSAVDTLTQTPEAYEAMFPVPERSGGDMLFSTGENLGTVLEGRSIMFFGDSLLDAYGLDDYRQSWCGLLGSEYGMEITDNAISASTFSVSDEYGYHPGGCYEPYCQRELPAGDFDVILVAGSGNDWYCEIPLGSDLESRDTGTLMGAMNTVIDRLQEAYPEALLLFVTSWNSTGSVSGLGYTTADYNSTFIQVCENRGVPCFQAFDPAISGIDSASKAFRSEYFLAYWDYWHLNAKGHKLFLPVIAQWIQDMMLEHYVVSGFYDVTVNDWYAEAVRFAVEQGVTNGTSETTFEPDTVMQRAMLLTMLYRMAGSPDVSGMTHPFVDLDPEQYYYDAVIWGYNEGITTGIDETHFVPEGELTREQLATFLYRYAKAEETECTDAAIAFQDAAEISEFAWDAMNWAVASDLLHGGGDGTLMPKRAAIRAEMIQLLANYLQK